MERRDPIDALTDAGFDIAHAFDAHAAAREPGWSCLASDPARRRGLLIGNTRRLWPRFVAARDGGPLAPTRDPLDRYASLTVASTFASAPTWFVHQRYDGAFLPFQRLAVATGFAALAPSHLLVHPTYGPWFALRAVVLLEGDAPTMPERALEKPCSCTGACERALAAALATSGEPARDARAAWLAVRDACELRAWRYGDEQIAYHYGRALPGS